MEPIEQIERAGYTAKIYQDQDPSSPAEWDTLGTLEYQTREASVGDLPRGADAFEQDCSMCDGTGELQDVANGESAGECPKCNGRAYVTDGEAICKARNDSVVCLPVRAWDGYHGTTLELAESWEEANGWIYATQEQIDMTGVPLEAVAAGLELELKTWEQWAQGDVYGIVIENPAGEEVDSCWRFYGLDYTMGEAKGMLDIEEVRLIESHPNLANVVIN